MHNLWREDAQSRLFAWIVDLIVCLFVYPSFANLFTPFGQLLRYADKRIVNNTESVHTSKGTTFKWINTIP